MKNLLENAEVMINPPPQRIIWCYGQWQPLYKEMQAKLPIEFIKDLPISLDEDSFLDPSVRNLIVIVDLMNSAANNQTVSDLFTKGSHHRNLSVFCLLQNIYPPGREMRSIGQNTQYMALFYMPRQDNNNNI